MGFTNSSKKNIVEQEMHQYLLSVSNQCINFNTSIETSPEKHNPEVNDNELLSYSRAVMNKKVPWPLF